MRVIATAGHVDHGKSSLVRRLTGIDPDRLAEEKARAMTIDLGFAWLSLSNGETLGIIDVPGHRDFIANMLAGMGGIDAALLVIAADEGVMPQTVEHLAILDLLGIERSIVVLTKIDLISDPEWLDLVKVDIRRTIANTRLAVCEIIPVSSVTGMGIPYLLEQITVLLATALPHPAVQQPRLSIDRVFTVSGFGTVVTGTLREGSLHVGDEVEIQPANRRGRIRGLQSYKQTVVTAHPGSRVAVNLAGVDHHAIERGEMLAYLNSIQPTDLIDVYFKYLPDLDRTLKHDAKVKFFVGAAESMARVRLLNDQGILPGSEGWIQLVLDRLVAVVPFDRFILRYPSPAQTIGGGVIVNAHPSRRWRRFQPAVIAELETRLNGTPTQRIALAASTPLESAALLQMLGYGQAELDEALAQGQIIALSDGSILSASVWGSLSACIVEEVRTFHAAMPLRLGISREELRSRLDQSPVLLDLYIKQMPELVLEKSIIRHRDHQVLFDYAQSSQIGQFMVVMNSSTPPSMTDAAQLISSELLHALIDLGVIIKLQPDVILTPEIYASMVSSVLELIDANGSTTVAEVRDRCNTTRKYALALLEHLDAVGKTRRQGDMRVRGRS